MQIKKHRSLGTHQQTNNTDILIVYGIFATEKHAINASKDYHIMANTIKNQQEILDKLKIKKLNPMQQEAQLSIQKNDNTLLLSPTGTGKTLAYLLPIIENLDINCPEIQALILVPSRELAIQIEQVTKTMGTGFKANAVYGGRAGTLDKMDLRHRPAILIGTPGRIADRFRRDNLNLKQIKTLVLDEFDKSLELGFEAEMKQIVTALPAVRKRILSSATNAVEPPAWVKLEQAVTIDYLSQRIDKLQLRTIISPTKDKLSTLAKTLQHIGNERGIVFCNFKDTIQIVSTFLEKQGIEHACFYGGMEQQDRENALIKFRNGTHKIIIATDLAARGIDVPEMKFIVHYELPPREIEFTHRNGRTARMNAGGTAYIIKWQQERSRSFIVDVDLLELQQAAELEPSKWTTLLISGGRRHKISKGDLAGLFLKQAKLSSEQLGIIELKPDCAFVAVQASEAERVIALVNNSKLKKKKVRISIL